MVQPPDKLLAINERHNNAVTHINIDTISSFTYFNDNQRVGIRTTRPTRSEFRLYDFEFHDPDKIVYNKLLKIFGSV